VPAAGLTDHLVAVHGYLELTGTLLPRDVALTCLWDRVFSKGDVQAHEQVCLLLDGPPDGRTNQRPYVAALEVELRHRLDQPGNQRQERARWIHNLRKSVAARAYFWDLLKADDPRVRILGREVLLPEVGEALAGSGVTAADVRRWLDKLCPVEEIWEKIRACQRLAQFGAARQPAQECLRQLQGERPVACPRCSAAVAQAELEEHLRQYHRIYQFRGAQGSRAEITAALLSAVCSPNPEYEAWSALEALVREEWPQDVDAKIAVLLNQRLQALPEETAKEASIALAEVLAGSERGREMAQYLANLQERPAQQLALLTIMRLPPPLSRPLVRAARPLLVRRRAPFEIQISAAAALLRTTGNDGPRAAKIIRSLIAGCRKVAALERLRRLQEQVGPSSMLSKGYLKIENRIRMRCPRCDVKLRRPAMAQHVWLRHGLLLDGRRVREPWHLIEDWISAHARSHQPELLVRCRQLAQYLGGSQGLQRVYRLFLSKGVADVEARQMLLAQARRQRATLCPTCYAAVPVPEEVGVQPLNQSHGRLSLHGYCVEVSESGWVPQLLLETPTAGVYRGREPERSLTRPGAVLALVGPLVLAALALAVALRLTGLPGSWLDWSVGGMLGLALVTYFLVQVSGRDRPKPSERALDYGWSRLAPLLHAKEFSLEDSTFLAGLALDSIDRGRPSFRVDSLARVLRFTENAVAGRDAPLSHLALLHRLEIADAARSGEDPIPLVAWQLGRCLEGELPLSFAQELLADWESTWWTPGNLARLRVLLCDHAYAVGLEVGDLLQAGVAVPPLGSVLQIDRPQELAQLRLLWSLRPRPPWGNWSKPQLAFELASDPHLGRTLFDKYPDLLLAEPGLPSILLCGRGVVFQDVLFTEPPRRVETRSQRGAERPDYEVHVGERRFHFPRDPSAQVSRLERWFRHHFHDFLPQLPKVSSWRAPENAPVLHVQQTVVCPECQHLLLPRVGDVGGSVDRRPSRRAAQASR
jgi:hypothetical protein